MEEKASSLDIETEERSDMKCYKNMELDEEKKGKYLHERAHDFPQSINQESAIEMKETTEGFEQIVHTDMCCWLGWCTKEDYVTSSTKSYIDNSTQQTIKNTQDEFREESTEAVTKNGQFTESILLNIEFLQNLYTVTCSLCSIKYDLNDGIIMETCLHVFCRECVDDLILPNRNENVFPDEDIHYIEEYLKLDTSTREEPISSRSELQDIKPKDPELPKSNKDTSSPSAYFYITNIFNHFWCIICNASAYKLKLPNTDDINNKQIFDGLKQFYAQNENNLLDENSPDYWQDDQQDDQHTDKVCKTCSQICEMNRGDKLNENFCRGAIRKQVIRLMEPQIFQECSDTSKQMKLKPSLDDSMNSDVIACCLCSQIFKLDESVFLDNCSHCFCRPCIVKAIKDSDEETVNCPYVEVKEFYTVCPAKLTENEIQTFADTETYNRRLAKMTVMCIQQGNEQIYNCRTEDCSYWCYGDVNVITFTCPVCNRINDISKSKLDEETNLTSAASVADNRNLEPLEAENNKILIKSIKIKCSMCEETIESHIAILINDSSAVCRRCYSDMLMCNSPERKNSSLPPRDSGCSTKLQNDHIKKKEEENLTKSGLEIARIGAYEELKLIGEACVQNYESLLCPICQEWYNIKECVILTNCAHIFCKECLTYLIIYSNDAEVECPYMEGYSKCGKHITHFEIKAIVPAEVYDKFVGLSIARAESCAGKRAYHCKTIDCDYWCYVEDNVDAFVCFICNRKNCINCQDIHDGITCNQYKLLMTGKEEFEKQDTFIKNMLDNAEALACPTCRSIITKEGGCDWIQCSQCQTEICWPTKGPRWGPLGHGDTSGGCKCTAIRKCHVNCNNCHLY